MRPMQARVVAGAGTVRLLLAIVVGLGAMGLAERAPAGVVAQRHYAQAVRRCERGEYHEALAAFRACSEAPGVSSDQQKRIRLYVDLIDKHAATDASALRLFVKHIRLQREEAYDESIAAARELVAKFPQSAMAPRARNAIAFVYLVDTKDYERAIAEFNALLQSNPSSALVDNALFGIASAEERQRRYQAALKVYKRLKQRHTGMFWRAKKGRWSKFWFSRASARINAIECMVSGNDYLGVVAKWTPYDSKYGRVERFLGTQPYRQAHRGALSGRQVYLRAKDVMRRAYSIPYLSEPASQDFWQTPPETERRPGGDCEDQAFWLFDRLRGQGIKACRVFVGKKNGADGNLHAWVFLYTESAAYVLDPTCLSRLYESRGFTKSEYQPYFSYAFETRWRHGRAWTDAARGIGDSGVE